MIVTFAGEVYDCERSAWEKNAQNKSPSVKLSHIFEVLMTKADKNKQRFDKITLFSTILVVRFIRH